MRHLFVVTCVVSRTLQASSLSLSRPNARHQRFFRTCQYPRLTSFHQAPPAHSDDIHEAKPIVDTINDANEAPVHILSIDDHAIDEPAVVVTPSPRPLREQSSTRNMLKFTIPALGIYLSNPLLSNIDNAFVGRTVGTSGLAALSPATILIDQMLYLFSFLSRATTGMVSRAYGAIDDANETGGNYDAARQAASAPLTVSILCGMFLTVVYAIGTPTLLAMFRVDASLRPMAASYIYWRGAIAWAALAQSVCLSTLMATRDALTPLKIVALASILNVFGDALCCVWPLRMGCAGAAAATTAATLVSCAVMLRALHQKALLPRLHLPNRQDLKALLEFTGPLLAITITRLAGFITMQQTVMSLGVQPLAAYQLCRNIMMFFMLFGEPLSQLAQTKLPAIIDANDRQAVVGTLRSILPFAAGASAVVGSVAYATVFHGSVWFSSDAMVLALTKTAAPSIFFAVTTAIFTLAMDGALMASKDFSYMLLAGLGTYVGQVYLLRNYCTSVGFAFGTFTMRLGLYSVLALVWVGLGYGPLGRAIIRTKLTLATP